MNRMLIGGLAALVLAGGGSAWWMMNQASVALGGKTETITPPADEIADSAVGPEVSPALETANAEDVDSASVDLTAVMAAKASETVSIERGACFGPCPIYKATVYGDDRLVFEGMKFVKRSGKHEAALPRGAFAKLVEIGKRHNFAAMDTQWPDEKGLNCPEPPTDLPTVIIAYATAEIAHRVAYYEGCGGTPAAERVEAMVADLDKALALDEWIGSRSEWYGKRDAPDK